MNSRVNSRQNLLWLCMQDIRGTNSFDLESTPQKAPDGHVVAVRVTSEDAGKGFKPTSGRIDQLHFRATPEARAMTVVSAIAHACHIHTMAARMPAGASSPHRASQPVAVLSHPRGLWPMWSPCRCRAEPHLQVSALASSPSAAATTCILCHYQGATHCLHQHPCFERARMPSSPKKSKHRVTRANNGLAEL